MKAKISACDGVPGNSVCATCMRRQLVKEPKMKPPIFSNGYCMYRIKTK